MFVRWVTDGSHMTIHIHIHILIECKQFHQICTKWMTRTRIASHTCRCHKTYTRAQQVNNIQLFCTWTRAPPPRRTLNIVHFIILARLFRVPAARIRVFVCVRCSHFYCFTKTVHTRSKNMRLFFCWFILFYTRALVLLWVFVIYSQFSQIIYSVHIYIE